jgi:ankyrin repeat protein
VFNFCPLHYSCKINNEYAVRILIYYGSHLSIGDTLGLPIHYASSPGVKHILIQYGSPVDIKNTYGKTPLHLERTNIGAKILLENSKNINIQDSEMNWTPLHYMVNDIETIESHVVYNFLQYGANPNIQDWKGKTPLHYAITKYINKLLQNSYKESWCLNMIIHPLLSWGS